MASSSSNFLMAEEIRKNAATWSLEGDNKLLGFMKIISENLEKRAVTTKKNLNRLVFDIEHTSVALDNAINKFAALQHHQFVENRIREDDEIVKTAETNNVLNNKEQESHNHPIDALKIIVKNGLDALHDCYEKISVDIEDSDEEDEQMKSIIYRPKNPFDRRPLPYIIGTNEWKEKWHIGLCDSDEDYSDDNNEQYSSDSESENISLTASLPSNAPTISESEISSTWGPQKNPTGNLINKKKFTNLSDDDDNVEDEISSNTITSKNSSEDSRNHMTQTNLMNNIPIPDQRYYVHQTKEKNLFDESSSNESDNNMDLERDNNNHNSNSILIKSNYDNKNINNIHQKIKSEIEKMNSKKFNNAISNIINDEPPSDIDEVDKDKFDQKYFIENDIEYSSSEIEEKNKNQNINKNDEKKNLSSVTENQNQNDKRFDNNNIRQKTVNLFDDDDFNSFMKELDKKNIEKLTNNDIGSTIKAKNLFEDDETEDEANIFTPKRLMHEPVQTIKVVKENVSVSENIVNTKYQENKLKENATKTKISNLFDDEILDDDDDFDAIFGRKNPINNKNIENSEKLSDNSNALFSDDKNSNSIHNNSSSVINKNIASSSHISNLFSEEPPHDYDDDDAFNIDKNKYTENTAIKKNSSNQNQSQKGINIFSDNNLLNDNDDNDLFSDKTFINDTNTISDKFDNSISIVDTNKAIESINKLENHKNLFYDKNIENNNQMNNSNTNVSHQNSKINKSSKTNLFSDDDDDDDDDIFDFSNRHRDKSKITTNIVVNEKGIENEENKNVNITNVMNKFNSSNITNLFSDNEDEDDDSIFEIIKKSNNSKNTTNENTNEIKNPIEVDSIVTKNSNKNHQNDKVINQINNDNNEKITINSNISSLMNIFSNEPPTDIENDNDDDDDILFGIKSSNNNNKSMTNNTTEKLKKSLSLSPAEKILDNDKKEEKSGTIKLSSSVSNSHTLLDTISEMDRIKLNPEKFENNVISHSHSHREKLFFNNQTPPNDDILFANNNESEEKNKKNDNYKLMKEQVPKNDCEKIYNLNDNNVSENIIKSAVENIIRKDKIFDKDNQETDSVDKNLLHNNEINTEINSNNTVIMKNENEEFVPKNYDKITSIITEETVVEKITFNDSSSLSSNNNNNNNNNNYDDDNDDTSSITNSTDKLSEKSINYNTLNYNPVGIFQDIPPPDDDFQISNNDQKQRHNIFYDDFSETIISSDVTTTSIPSLLSSNYNNIFSDEPPPDIFDQQIHQSITSIQGKINDKIENSTNDIKSSSSISTSSDLNISIKENEEKKQQSVTELAKKVNDFIKDSEFNTTKSLSSSSSSSSSSPIKLPQPKKLNKKLNINVAALLPGVKRPTTNFASENEKYSNEEISDAIQITVSDQKYSASSSITTLNDGDANERNILKSLNKTRAKIPVKRRRPSSRNARHENYRKSLLVSNDEDFVNTNDDYTSNDILKGNNINEIKSLTSNSDQIKKSDNIITSNNTNVNDNFQSSILDENKEHKNENLFDDINREDENSIHEQKNDIKKVPNKQISIGFLSSDDDDDDDDLFSQNKTIISTSVDNSKKSELNDLPVVTTLSNVITGTVTIAAATPTISTATASVVAAATTTTTTKSTATTLKKSDKHFKSIFQDDSGDDDEDDLFGTKSKNRNYDKQSQEQKQKQQINPSSLTTHKQSIFSSDDDDDTDLFGGGGGGGVGVVKSIKRTTAPITSAINHKTERTIDKPKMSSTIKKSGSIFDDNKLGNNENDYKDHDDDDDDDDLFGTKSSKNLDKLRTVPIPKKIEKKIIASGKGLSDNPLSDLLND